MSVFLSGAKSRDWQPDEISQAVGDKRYGTPWSWRGLTRVCLGNLVKGQVTVTRYYLLRRPKLIIDFEPAPITGVKLFCEEKRRWAQNKGIVYVLIFLREKLTVDQLKARIDEETASMHRRAEERRLAEVVTSHPTPDRGTWRPQFEDPRVVEYIEQETLTRFAAEETVAVPEARSEAAHVHTSIAVPRAAGMREPCASISKLILEEFPQMASPFIGGCVRITVVQNGYASLPVELFKERNQGSGILVGDGAVLQLLGHACQSG